MIVCDNFRDVCSGCREGYLSALRACPGRASDYSFANLYGWAPHYGLKWRREGGLVWIRQTRPVDVFWAPVGDWRGADWSAFECLRGPAKFIRVPEELLAIWRGVFGERVSAVESRDDFDYVYSLPELVALEGGRFHKKKNLLRQFEKSYVSEYSPLTEEIVGEVLEMQGEWLARQEPSAALVAENEAVRRVFGVYAEAGLLGGVLRVDGRIVAYTVAERLFGDTLVIHFEKGDTRFKGVYQAINQRFLAASGAGCAFVNREQDVGDEGLRKSKMSYHPAGFVPKYTVTFA